MKFRNDIDIDSTWVVSDTHFGHENIVGFCHRPLDHDQVMIAEWRKEVPDDATVLHLGDLCYKGNAFFKHITAKELTGARKLLIRGNHDKNPDSFYRTCGFQLVRPFKIAVGNKYGDGRTIALDEGNFETVWNVSFSHYPWSATDDAIQGPCDLRIHGHIHNNGYSRDAFVPFLRNHINLSVEQTKYRPVNLGVLLRAYLLGDYPETTQEQLAEARARKEANSK